MQTLYFDTHRELRDAFCKTCPKKEMGLCRRDEPLTCDAAKDACAEIMRRKGCVVRVGNFVFSPNQGRLMEPRKGGES